MALALCCLELAFPAALWANTAPIPIRVLMPAPFADATANLVRQYNASQQAVDVQVERGPLNTEAISDLAISSLLLGDSPYDLLLMDVTWTPKYVAAGWLEPLEPLLGETADAGLVAGADLGNRFNGHLWRLPLLASTGLLFWRQDLLPEPPRTTDELVSMARSQQSQGTVRWGYVWQGRQYEGLSCVFLEVLSGFGGHWLNPENSSQPELDSPEALAATRWLDELIRQGISPPSVVNMAEQDSLQSFRSGEALFMRNWPYAWNELQKPGSGVKDKVGVSLPVPAPGHAPTSTQGSWGLSLLKGSSHPQQAAEVIRWFTSIDVQTALLRDSGYPPTLQAIYDNAALQQELPLLPLLKRSLAAAKLRPATPLYAQLSDLAQRRLSGIFTGADPVDPAMAQLQRQSQILMQASGARSEA